MAGDDGVPAQIHVKPLAQTREIRSRASHRYTMAPSPLMEVVNMASSPVPSPVAKSPVRAVAAFGDENATPVSANKPFTPEVRARYPEFFPGAPPGNNRH